MRAFLTTILLIASSAAYAGPFHQMYGSYKIKSCHSSGAKNLPAHLNFCRYDRLSLGRDSRDSDITAISFRKGTNAPLSWRMRSPQASLTNMYLESRDTAELRSQNNGVQSTTSFNRITRNIVRLNLTTIAQNGQSYSFDIVLKRK
jgi:hypothetical protein